MLARIRTWWSFRHTVARATQSDEADCSRPLDVALIPCWRRPEFLWHCLDNLSRAEGIANVHLMFRLDTGYSRENLQVIDSFADRLPNYEIRFTEPCPFRRTKPSANLLIGLLHAATQARRLVFLLEEDIMVARDYFTWHHAVHAASTALFCSIPVKNPNRALALPADSGGYYLSSGDCCSNGMCFDRQVLLEAVAPHVNMAYLRRPKKYIRRHFPASSIGLGYVEQAGLIRRIQEQSTRPIAWPCVPRAFHAGFYGARGRWHTFTRPRRMQCALQDRVRILAETIYDPESVSAAIDHPDFLPSCLPCDLQPPRWQVLRQIPVQSLDTGDAHKQ